MNRLKYWLINLAAVSLFLTDIFLKRIFLALPGQEYFILGSLVKLKLATNNGVAFGLLAQTGLLANQQLFLYFYIFIFLILAYWLIKEYRKKNRILMLD